LFGLYIYFVVTLLYVMLYTQVLISEVLRAKHAYRWVDPVVSRDATVRDVIQIVIDGGLSGMMVIDESTEHSTKKVVGLLTSRDILRIMASGFKDGDSVENIMKRNVSNFMTPISQVIFGRPEETIGMIRTIMAKLGIKCIPILNKEGSVVGLITARDMSDFGLSATDKGGKKSYLNDVSERVGLSSNTSMAEPPAFMQAHLGLEQIPLYCNVGVAELPHPFKTAFDGVGANRRGA
jgi:CBS domain-containing protein